MSNPWKDFLELLPTEEKWIAKIKSITGTKALVNKLAGVGGSISDDILVDIPPTGYSVDDYVFIKGSTIINKTPNIRAAFRETIY
jgi:hypothetical protein